MGRFAEGYRRHFGATESAPQFYGGLTLFFAGAAAALTGVLVAVSGGFGDAVEARRSARELGIVLAAVGLPFFLYGLQLTLPARRVVHLVSLAAVAFTAWGIVRFVNAYPQAFNQGTGDQAPQVILTYAAGLVVLITATAMALVVNFISRHTVLPGHELDDVYSDPDRPVTMEEVLRDIEREVSRQNLTWGGVSGDRVPSQVLKMIAEFGPEYEVSNATGARTLVLPMDDSSEKGYRELMRLRGRDVREEGSDDTQRAVDALVALRQARQAELERSWWYRLKRWFVGLFTGGRRRRHTVTAGLKPERQNPNAEERPTGNARPAPEAELVGRAR